VHVDSGSRERGKLSINRVFESLVTVIFRNIFVWKCIKIKKKI
jgi:hypothetical protein